MSFFNILWTISNTSIGLYFKFTKFVSGYKTHIKWTTLYLNSICRKTGWQAQT